MIDSTSEESMVEETSCAACHAQISVYAEMTGLLPEEHIDGRRATHSWLVCKLRQELNARSTVPAVGSSDDWTCDETGRANSSKEYLHVSAAVRDLIRDSARTIFDGDIDGAARLIVSQLAYVHGMRPVQEKP